MRRACLIAAIGLLSMTPLAGRAAAPGIAAPPAPFLGIVASPYDGPTLVGCLDALSLRPTSPPVEIGEYHHAWSRSPDGARVALGMSVPGRERRIGVKIVNLARVAVDREVETGIAAEGVAWLTDRRLVAKLQDGGILLIDPATGAIARRWEGGRVPYPATTARTRRRFAMLEPGPRTSRLAVVDDTGSLRRVSFRLPLERGMRAALVADPAGERAYVLSGGRAAVEVDLRRMRARSRRLRPEGSRRPAPAREREALWLGAGLLAITGRDYPSGRGIGARSVPAGLSIVDVASWGVRRVDAAASGAAFAGGRLLAYGGRGVRAYAPNGRRLWTVLRGRTVWSLGTRGRLAYAVTGAATYVVDLRSGKVRRKIPRPRELGGVIARRCAGRPRR